MGFKGPSSRGFALQCVCPPPPAIELCPVRTIQHEHPTSNHASIYSADWEDEVHFRNRVVESLGLAVGNQILVKPLAIGPKFKDRAICDVAES